tara:strand:+ start:109 stop:717 length:609 start_codon:yes stop_codon:yes gene_type:complete
MSWERLDNMTSRELMSTLAGYCTWTTEDQILRDAYGDDAMKCEGYRSEKLRTLQRRGLLGLWQELDNFNRASLAKNIERYTWPKGVQYSHVDWNKRENCEFLQAYEVYDIWVARESDGTLDHYILRYGHEDKCFYLIDRDEVKSWRTRWNELCPATIPFYIDVTPILNAHLASEEEKEQEKAKEEGKFWSDNVNEKPLPSGA